MKSKPVNEMLNSDSFVQPLLAGRAAHLSGRLQAAQGHGAISFDSGHACPDLLPDLTEEAMRALGEHRSETLQYSGRPGLPEMRDIIAGMLREDGVVGATPSRVIVVNGAKHGLDLLCHLLLDPGDTIVVTAPMYFTAIPIFRGFGVDYIEVGQDQEGLSVDELEEALKRHRSAGGKPPKFIYTVPDFHNPTGLTMSLRRRKDLLAIAAGNGIPVIEDSPYRRVRFEGTSEPSLAALDEHGLVLGLGTFSKLVAPGLRVGWVFAPEPVIARLIQMKTDGGSCPLTQRIVVEFCKAGRLAAHVQTVQGRYREHRDRMIAALARDLPDVEYEVPMGGYYLWLRFPSGTDTDALAARALEAGVSTIAGSRFYAKQGPRAGGHGELPRRHMRLAYTHASPREIDEGIGILARTCRELELV